MDAKVYYTPHSVGEYIEIELKIILDRLLLREDAVSNVETTKDSWRFKLLCNQRDGVD